MKAPVARVADALEQRIRLYGELLVLALPVVACWQQRQEVYSLTSSVDDGTAEVNLLGHHS